MTLIIEMAAFIVVAVLVAVLVGVTAAALMLKIEGSGAAKTAPGPLEGAASDLDERERRTLAAR
jgi:hypothetical protein